MIDWHKQNAKRSELISETLCKKFGLTPEDLRGLLKVKH
jgi:hypothetical protein